jgi:predicted ATPase
LAEIGAVIRGRALEAVLRDASGGTEEGVLVRGEAGIGKSRLVAELKEPPTRRRADCC